jgi:Trk K+ transport system NAD-binding subunit
LDVRDYAAVLHLSGEYQITDLAINPGDWIANKMIKETKLWEEGIIVLGINRKNGNYLGSPAGETGILPGDVLTVYGKASALKELDERRKGSHGDEKHKEAVLQHEENMKKE